MSKKNQKESVIWQWNLMEYISYFVIFMFPLMIGKNLLYSFITSKALFLTFFTLVMGILYFWGSWNKKESRLRVTPIHISLFLFVVVLTISSIFGVDPLNSFFGWRYAVSLLHIYILIIFALLIGFLVKRNKNFIINILTCSFLSSIIVTIIFYTGLSVKTADGSTMGNSSYLGEYLFFNVLFGLGLFLYFKKYWKKILIALGTLFIILSPIFVNKDILIGKISIIEAIKHPTLFFGIANGAAMGIGISVLVMGLLFLASSRKKLIKITGFVLLASFLFGVYYTGKLLVNPDSSLHKVYVEQKSGNRFLAWDIAKESFSQNPLLGVGLNNYPYSYEKYFTTDFYKKGNSLERFNQPHNMFWEFASNTGILGLISFLILLVTTFISLFNRNENLESIEDKQISNVSVDSLKESSRLKGLIIVLTSILFGYFIQNLFVFDTIATYTMLFLIVGIAIGVSSYSWDFKIKRNLDIIKKILLIFFILSCIVSVVMFVFLPIREAKQWNKMALKSQTILDFYENKEEIQNISLMGGIFDSTFMADHLFESFQDNLNKVRNNNKNDFLKVIEYVVLQVEKDTKIQPNYADAYFMIGNYLNLYMLVDLKDGEYLKFDGKNYNKEVWDRAYKALTKSIELNPNNPKQYFSLSKTYMIKGDIVEARKIAQKGISIAPENKEAYKFSRVLLSVPDKDFENYVNSMEKKWITDNK